MVRPWLVIVSKKSHIRFDDSRYRREHRSDDKLAPVRNVFEMWETTLSDAFVPSENVTVYR